jgi:hypothetical protein
MKLRILNKAEVGAFLYNKYFKFLFWVQALNPHEHWWI